MHVLEQTAPWGSGGEGGDIGGGIEGGSSSYESASVPTARRRSVSPAFSGEAMMMPEAVILCTPTLTEP